MKIRIRSTDKNSIFMLAEAVVNTEPGTIISVDTPHLFDLAQQKMEQVHRDDIEIKMERD